MRKEIKILAVIGVRFCLNLRTKLPYNITHTPSASTSPSGKVEPGG